MNRLSRLSLAWCLAASSTFTMASTVTASYALVTGNTWQASFTFGNGAGEQAAPGLTVYFDETLYANLANAVAPAGWDPLLIQPDAVLGAGLFDVYAGSMADALQAGQTLSGFSVQFDYLGTGAPGTLDWEFYRIDGMDLTVLQSGTTTAATLDVPEPGTLWLGAAALAGLMGAQRRRAAVARTEEVAQ